MENVMKARKDVSNLSCNRNILNLAILILNFVYLRHHFGLLCQYLSL